MPDGVKDSKARTSRQARAQEGDFRSRGQVRRDSRREGGDKDSSSRKGDGKSH